MVRSPQSAVYLKRFTLRRVMLQGYNKSILISEKTFSLILWKRVGHIWYRQALASCWRNISARDSLTKTRNTEHSFTARRPPSCLQSRHFRFYPPLPSQVFLIGWQFLFFINRKIKKRFSFWISSSLILFPAVSLHMKLLCQVWIFNKLEFRE